MFYFDLCCEWIKSNKMEGKNLTFGDNFSYTRYDGERGFYLIYNEI